MPNRSRKKRLADPNQMAASIAQEASAEPPEEPRQKNPHAVALGRLGGMKGGKARAAKMTEKQRSEAARKAARARWKR